MKKPQKTTFVSIEALYTAAVQNSVHAAEAVVDLPRITLEAWTVRRVSLDGATLTDHFVGDSPELCEGRVSSEIVMYDPKLRLGVSASGRIYELHGKPGRSSDAEYVWNRWCKLNKITDVEDVSPEYLEQQVTARKGTIRKPPTPVSVEDMNVSASWHKKEAGY